MKWVLILLAVGGTAGPGVQAGFSVGEYPTQDQCRAVAKLAINDGFKPYCYPVGDVSALMKKPDAAGPKPEKKAKP
ncbi:hypothetical protein [Taklimakanibacter deserti]|uniref:hypothetical protein n=1 Tax=Taklimakanibacter deserti TaxID=2267839 RepID=UPI000E65DD3D